MGPSDAPAGPARGLLRERYPSRAALAAATGLPYETLRTYTDGLWRATRPLPRPIFAGLARAVELTEFVAAVNASQDETEWLRAVARPGWTAALNALDGYDEALLGRAALPSQISSNGSARSATRRMRSERRPWASAGRYGRSRGPGAGSCGVAVRACARASCSSAASRIEGCGLRRAAAAVGRG